MIVSVNGQPVAFGIYTNSFHDITDFETMNIDLPENSRLYADSAYAFYELEDLEYT